MVANSIARLGGSSDHSDLDEQAGNEVRAHRRPHRLHPREPLLVDRVERGEVSQVDEVNKARNDVVERCSGSLEHGLDVGEGLLGLFDQIVATTLPVFGSKPPWPDRKIHSPTVTPGEYGPAGAGSLSELTRAFMDGGLLEVG